MYVWVLQVDSIKREGKDGAVIHLSDGTASCEVRMPWSEAQTICFHDCWSLSRPSKEPLLMPGQKWLE
jgi:hypothetical protein